MSTKSDEAAGVLRIATRRMAGAYPLHAHLLSMARVDEDSQIDTMAVTIRGAQLVFLYNADFVLAHRIEEIVGVLHHEVLHVVLGHLLQTPQRYPDRRARTIAEEVTVNEWVREPLPGNPILLKDFPKLPPLEDTDRRYHRLKSKRAGRPLGATIDNHGVWGEARSAGRLAGVVIASAVGRAVGMLTPQELSRIPPQVLAACMGTCRGDSPGSAIEQLGCRKGAGSVPWQQELRRFVGRTTGRHPSYLRPPRRFPHLVGIVPGNTRRSSSPRVMAVIDTSASVTPDILGQIAAELRMIGSSHEVVVVECDARIQRTYPFEGDLGEVHGRGGTDLRPPFEREVLTKLRPDVVVYFTDGQGPAPKDSPRVPVLWCLTAGARAPALWGRAVWMTRS